MIGDDGWRKVRRAVTSAKAISDAARGDEDVIPRTGGTQSRPSGPQRASDPMPLPRATGPPYPPLHHQQDQYFGPPMQDQYQGQPSQPYTSPQPTGGQFNPIQRTYSSPATTHGPSPQSSPVQTFDQNYRNQAPSAPPPSTNAIGAIPYNRPQGSSPPASNPFPQDQRYASPDPRYPQGSPTSPQQGYPYQESYPSQSHQDQQYQPQFGPRMGSWNQSGEPGTYQSSTISTCMYCRNYLTQYVTPKLQLLQVP